MTEDRKGPEGRNGETFIEKLKRGDSTHWKMILGAIVIVTTISVLSDLLS